MRLMRLVVYLKEPVYIGDHSEEDGWYLQKLLHDQAVNEIKQKVANVVKVEKEEE
jgi:hypothetical protein